MTHSLREEIERGPRLKSRIHGAISDCGPDHETTEEYALRLVLDALEQCEAEITFDKLRPTVDSGVEDFALSEVVRRARKAIRAFAATLTTTPGQEQRGVPNSTAPLDLATATPTNVVGNAPVPGSPAERRKGE
jgi:hypothetical protein